jgi:cold shock CspA family protein
LSVLTDGTGVVAEFDELRGLGVIRGDDGADVPFHCTAIADGSRTVETGRRVSYEVVPGLLGRWEASGVEKL